MGELRPKRFGLVEKASDGFGRTGKFTPMTESTMEEVIKGIRLLVIGDELDMACSEFPQ